MTGGRRAVHRPGVPMPSLTTPRAAATSAAAPPGRHRIYRHALPVRISHWVNVLCLTALLLGGHLRRDLLPSGRDLAHIGRSLWDHLRLRFPKGEEAKRYNVLQKLAYLATVFALGPLIVLAGLTMSPRLDASFPVLLDNFGGRQSARAIHFLCAAALLRFVVIHLVMVGLSGLCTNPRPIITRPYTIT